MFCASCANFRYTRSEANVDIEVSLDEISKQEATKILDSYFKAYPYNESENKYVFFLKCEVKENCGDIVYSMYWSWTVSPILRCTREVDVINVQTNYSFKIGKKRCLM